MAAINDTSYAYKAVRKDLLNAICQQFAPARPQVALAAAAAACEKLSPEERRELAIETERKHAAISSERALKRFQGWSTKSEQQ